jgi:hypothetical protein
MGTKQSVLTSDESSSDREQDEEQCACFFLGKPLRTRASVESDPMGTPLPNTPLSQRRKRRLVMEEARRDPVMMSKYGGLEKETEDFCNDLLEEADNGTNGKHHDDGPQICEGKVCLIVVRGHD